MSATNAPGAGRATALAAIAMLALSGCSTSAVSTHGAPHAGLGIDNHGNQIASAWPAIPPSDRVGLLGDPSRRQIELGKEAFRGDNFGLAEKHFRKAVELRPDSATGWAGLAAAYDQLGRFDLADRAYDQLARLRGEDARVVNNRGYSYLLRGDYEKAERYLKRAQAIDPLLEEVDGNLHLLAKVRST